MSLKKTFLIKEELYLGDHDPAAVEEVNKAEQALMVALRNAGICPGCWYEDARGGWLADHKEDCPEA